MLNSFFRQNVEKTFFAKIKIKITKVSMEYDIKRNT